MLVGKTQFQIRKRKNLPQKSKFCLKIVSLSDLVIKQLNLLIFKSISYKISSNRFFKRNVCFDLERAQISEHCFRVVGKPNIITYLETSLEKTRLDSENHRLGDSETQILWDSETQRLQILRQSETRMTWVTRMMHDPGDLGDICVLHYFCDQCRPLYPCDLYNKAFKCWQFCTNRIFKRQIARKVLYNKKGVINATNIKC